MKRRYLVLVLLVLLILPHGRQSPNQAASAIQGPTETFALAADGDESSDSITIFSETISSDVLYYPDLFENTTVHLADDGWAVGSVTSGTWEDTKIKDGTDWHGAGATDLYLNFTIPSGMTVRGINYACYAYESGISGTVDLYIYDDVAETYDLIETVTSSPAWYNDTIYLTEYFVDENVTLALSPSSTKQAYWDYMEVTWYLMTLADHYAEPFASVADWTTSDTSISTDDDVATITENGAGSTGRAYASFSSTDFFEYYYEFRIESMTATTANLEFWDGDSYETLKTFTAAGTHKGIISDTDAATMQRIGFLVGSEGGNIKPDYLRISLSNESGFSHDGSTTSGVIDDGDSDYTYGISSDGDILTIDIERTSGSGTKTGNVTIEYDTTNTKTDLELDNYMFCEIRWRAPTFSSALYMGGVSIVDGYIAHLGSEMVYTTAVQSDWRTETYNIGALTNTTSDAAGFRFVVSTFMTTQKVIIEVDYVKYYSIVNFTVTQTGLDVGSSYPPSPAAKYLSVDSGVLVASEFTYGSDTWETGHFDLVYDPALSVDTSTYNIWNVTMSDGVDKFRFRHYVGSWTWEDTGETRGDFPSGTLTLIQTRLSGPCSLSEVKFIEDTGPPEIVDRWVNPPQPDDSEVVTFTAATSDGVEVYKVILNAVVYPVGFSDVDYEMTEETENQLWYYSFSTMIDGYYLFSITATDGANTDIEFLPVSVIEAGIILEEISFFGVGQDFTMMTFSFRINQDATYSINETSASNPESETHTGSVSKGVNNIAWNKLTTDDEQVNFTLFFVAGLLTKNLTGQYSVAQVTFDVTLSDKATTFDRVFLVGESTKAATYAVYDASNILRYTGTIPEGSWSLNFEMWNKRSLSDHAYGIKFVNNTSIDWINGSYYADSPDQYKGGGVDVGPVPWWQDPMTWVFIGGGLALVYVVTSGQKAGNIPNAPKGLK